MDDERLRVLKMVEEGQVTAEEAAKLLDALEASPPARRRVPATAVLRIRVVEAATGQLQTTVNVPLAVAQALAQVGSRVAALWAPQLGDFDLPKVLEAVQAGQPGRLVEWTEGGRRVEILIE